eukprot:760255-Hanusia_phi.AAC.2
MLEFPVSQSEFRASQVLITDTLSSVGSVPSSTVWVSSTIQTAGTLSAKRSAFRAQAGGEDSKENDGVRTRGRHLLQSQTNETNSTASIPSETSTTPSPSSPNTESSVPLSGVNRYDLCLVDAHNYHDAEDTTTPSPSESSVDLGCQIAIPTTKATVRAIVEIATDLQNVDQVWSRLNEYDINAGLSKNCLPPSLIIYMSSATKYSWYGWTTLATAIAALLMIERRTQKTSRLSKKALIDGGSASRVDSLEGDEEGGSMEGLVEGEEEEGSERKKERGERASEVERAWELRAGAGIDGAI